MPVSVQCITSSEFPDLVRDRWNTLAKTPLQSTQWMLSWWEAFQSRNSQLHILVLRSAGEIIGIAPMLLRASWSFGRTLQFLGSGSACTDYQTILAADGRESDVAESLVHWLVLGEGRNTWDVLELEGVGEYDNCICQLVHGLAKERVIKQATELEHTWRLDVSGGWEAVLKNLSKSQRSQTRNLVNRFDKNDALTLRVASESAELPTALQTCIELHQLRWQTAGKPGCFSDLRFSRFIESAVERLAGLGRARINLLEQDGVAVASQLVFLDNSDGIFVYQSGRDPRLDEHRVGQILTLVAIRNACDQGASFIDYLRGDEIYKSRLKSQPFGCQRIRIFATGTLPTLRYGVWKLGRELKSQAQTLRRTLAGTASGNL